MFLSVPQITVPYLYRSILFRYGRTCFKDNGSCHQFSHDFNW